jgi:hypothetical protein
MCAGLPGVVAAMAVYGIPDEVLTDIQDGKQFPGRASWAL